MATKMKKPGKSGSKSSGDAKQRSKVEKEILDLTGEKPQGEKETWGEYVERLTVALSDEKTVPEEKYDELSSETQAWFKQAADLVNDGKEDKVKPFPQDVAEEDEAVDTKAESPVKEDKKQKKAKKPEAKKEEDETPSKEEKEPAVKKAKEKKTKEKEKMEDPPQESTSKGEKQERGAPTKSGSAVAQRIVCEKLGEVTLDDLIAECKKRGAKISDKQVRVMLIHTSRVIRQLRDVGVRLTPPKS